VPSRGAGGFCARRRSGAGRQGCTVPGIRRRKLLLAINAPGEVGKRGDAHSGGGGAESVMAGGFRNHFASQGESLSGAAANWCGCLLATLRSACGKRQGPGWINRRGSGTADVSCFFRSRARGFEAEAVGCGNRTKPWICERRVGGEWNSDANLARGATVRESLLHEPSWKLQTRPQTTMPLTIKGQQSGELEIQTRALCPDLYSCRRCRSRRSDGA
jgi:hypothetical protein